VLSASAGTVALKPQPPDHQRRLLIKAQASWAPRADRGPGTAASAAPAPAFHLGDLRRRQDGLEVFFREVAANGFGISPQKVVDRPPESAPDLAVALEQHFSEQRVLPTDALHEAPLPVVTSRREDKRGPLPATPGRACWANSAASSPSRTHERAPAPSSSGRQQVDQPLERREPGLAAPARESELIGPGP